MKPLSPDMRRCLHYAVLLHDGYVGLTGSTRTIRALKKRGLVDDDLKITQAGKEALAGFTPGRYARRA